MLLCTTQYLHISHLVLLYKTFKNGNHTIHLSMPYVFWASLSKSSCSLYRSQIHFCPSVNSSSRYIAVNTVQLLSKPQPEYYQIHTKGKSLTLFMARGQGHHSQEEMKRVNTFWNTQQKNSSQVQDKKHCFMWSRMHERRQVCGWKQDL